MNQIFTPVAEEVLFNILPNVENFIPPAYGTPYSAALDVFAQDDFVITNETQLISLGFSAEFPVGTACLLLPRSGHGAKFGVALSNTAGLIDPDYRGEWKAALWLNGGGTKVKEISHHTWDVVDISLPGGGKTRDQEVHKKSELAIRRGEAFAQLLFVKTERPLPNIVSELSETVRGAGGFGSTDKIAK